MKLVISGGHLTPALALIDYLTKNQQSTEVIFVGRRYNRDSDNQPSQELREAEQRQLEFIPMRAARLNLRQPLRLFPEIFVFIGSLFKSLSIMTNNRPDVFVSFGGYLAFPLAVAAWILRIPIITHEQTRAVGVSNQVIAHLAQKVAISFPSSAEFFPKHKTVVTGNLVRPQLLDKNPSRPKFLDKMPAQPILYVTGGSQGSEVINMTIKHLLPQLTKDWQVIHQCGAASDNRSYLEELELSRSRLPKSRQANYVVREWITTEELSWIYRHARLVVSRAGANTTYELIFFSIPAVLIPLPFAHHQEQQKNAQSLVDTGGALIVQQNNLSAQTLLDAIKSLNRKYKASRHKLSQLTIIRDADQQLWELIQSVAASD